jgi:alkanesulfonate monooxygenase SsuD/methylene tetrahydromethanopterin reductase-like flavin-dependent oxidoreductase (luciferase family)
MPGRFILGVGTGENLNEHIVGAGWPETEIRHRRLVEAIEIIRLLFEGGLKSYHGAHFTVANARLYTLPATPPPDRDRGRRSQECRARRPPRRRPDRHLAGG